MAKRNRKHDSFDEHGIKIRSQHSLFGPVRRIAGSPGGPPRWQASLRASWNEYENADAIRRRIGAERGELPPPGVTGPRQLTLADLALPSLEAPEAA